MTHNPSMYTDSYLRNNDTKGWGKGNTVSTFLSYQLSGKAKQYSGGYQRALEKDLRARVASGNAVKGTSAGGGIAYYSVRMSQSNPKRKPAAAIIIGAKHQLKKGIKAAEKLANKIGHSVAVVLAPGGVRRSKRNTEGFKDASGMFHPIRSGDDYDPEDVGERRTYAPAKKKKAKAKRKATRRK